MAKNISSKNLNIAEIIECITKDKFIIEGKDGKVIVAKKIVTEQITVTK